VSIIPLYLVFYFAGDVYYMRGGPEENPPFDFPVPNSVDQLLNEMDLGSIAFNAPTEINIDDTPQIQLILSLTDTAEQLKQSITAAGDKLGAKIKVSNRMEARLTGYQFQITKVTPEVQAVSRNEQTEWKWEIEPKEAGRHNLYLTINALLEIDGQSTPRSIKTFDKQIEVHVTTTQWAKRFFEKNWQWLWTALLVPVVVWLWKRLNHKPEIPLAD
jgi:hypothetical protein